MYETLILALFRIFLYLNHCDGAAMLNQYTVENNVLLANLLYSESSGEDYAYLRYLAVEQ